MPLWSVEHGKTVAELVDDLTEDGEERDVVMLLAPIAVRCRAAEVPVQTDLARDSV